MPHETTTRMMPSTLARSSARRAVSLLVGLLLLAALAVGCTGPRRAIQIDRVDLWAQQGLVNVDADSSPDGVIVNVYFYSNNHPEPAVGSGMLDIILYDGKPGIPRLTDVKPLKTWTFAAQDLEGHRNKTLGLWNFQLMLIWSDAPPKSHVTTLVAKYHTLKGHEVYSAPTSILLRLP